MVFFVLSKLDSATRRAWRLKCSSEANPLKYNDLTRFLSSRASALEESPAIASKVKSIKSNNATTSENCEPTCILCDGHHFLSRCPTFLNKTTLQRRDYIKELKRCLNCFSAKHSVAECQNKSKCRICQKRHHSLLHLNSPTASANLANVKSETTNENLDSFEEARDSESDSPSQALSLSSISRGGPVASVLLATSKIIVRSDAGREQAVRALLDQGSEVTFMTTKLAQALKVQQSRTLTTISAVGGTEAGLCRSTACIKIMSRNRTGPIFSTRAFIIKLLTKYTPRCLRPRAGWQHLNNLNLADDKPFGTQSIDIIIGANLYGQILLGGIRKGAVNEPIAQRSHFGWIISGPTSCDTNISRKIEVHHCSLEQDVHRF